MPLPFVTLDVFSDRRFGGNPLAVVFGAEGLSDAEMLAVTREFNYSETTFVLPAATAEGSRRVRIFTPGGEIPFAGHPTIGTAIALVALGEVSADGDETTLVLEEGVGPVRVTVRTREGSAPWAQLSVAQLPWEEAPPADGAGIAHILSLQPEELLAGDYPPRVVSCGLPFLLVPVRTRECVRRARVRTEQWEHVLAGSSGSELMVFALDATAGADVRARVFVPGLSVPEDPATGSACAALAGYLAARTPRDNTTLRWTVEQGIEMGRPSRLELEADKQDGTITAIRVAGSAVMVMHGELL